MCQLNRQCIPCESPGPDRKESWKSDGTVKATELGPRPNPDSFHWYTVEVGLGTPKRVDTGDCPQSVSWTRLRSQMRLSQKRGRRNGRSAWTVGPCQMSTEPSRCQS